MQVRLTKAAIIAYASDLKARGNSTDAAALAQLDDIFTGFVSKSFNDFLNTASTAQVVASSFPNSALGVSDALPALESLHALMVKLSSMDRRRDLKALVQFLSKHESATISDVIDAVQGARRPQPARPAMSLDELKAQLDPSLGDDARFKPILAHLRKLDESEFAEVAKTALEVPFKNKREGLSRLQKLHTITRSNRMKEAAAAHKPAA